MRARAGQRQMAFQPITGPVSSPGSGIFSHSGFRAGERPAHHRPRPYPFHRGSKGRQGPGDCRSSRLPRPCHIISENGEFWVVDQGSKHGTFVNGERIHAQDLERNDRLEFGVRDIAYVIFHPLMPAPTRRANFSARFPASKSSPNHRPGKADAFSRSRTQAEYHWRAG